MTVGVMDEHRFVANDGDIHCHQILTSTSGDVTYCTRYKDHPLHTIAVAAAGSLMGVGPDVPKVTNAAGGQQSELHYRFDLIDGPALFALAQVLDYGTRVRGYPEQNWRLITVEDNLNHVLMHIYAHLAGDRQDKHLEHAFTRMMFALGVELAGGVPVK